MTINSLSSIAALFQTAGATALNKASQTASTDGIQQDSSKLSELAKLMKQLEEIRVSDPAKYKEITAAISTQLEGAAQSAASQGDSQSASMLNDMASKFKTASETGDEVDMRPPGPPRMGPPPSADDSSASSGAEITKLLKAFHQNQATDPMGILSSILQNALATQSA